MLDIIIPCYNSHDTIDKTLSSIVTQTKSNECKVTLVNDAGKNYKQIIKRYSKVLDIQEITYEKNNGPGYARNYGISMTNEPYIMFVDSDDMLASPVTISSIFLELENEPEIPYMITGIFAENYKGSIRTIKANKGYTHGKVYSRSFLDQYNIRFPNSACCEDAGFNIQCFCHGQNKVKLADFYTYYWMYNRNSLGRKDVLTWEYFTCHKGYTDNLIYAFNQVNKIRKDDLNIITEKVIGLEQIINMYLNSIQAVPQYKEANFENIKRYYNEVYKPIEKIATKDMFEFGLRSVGNAKEHLLNNITEVLKELQ